MEISPNHRNIKLQRYDQWRYIHFFDQPVKSDFRTYDNIHKTATGYGDYYTTDFLLDYP